MELTAKEKSAILSAYGNPSADRPETANLLSIAAFLKSARGQWLVLSVNNENNAFLRVFADSDDADYYADRLKIGNNIKRIIKGKMRVRGSVVALLTEFDERTPMPIHTLTFAKEFERA